MSVAYIEKPLSLRHTAAFCGKQTKKSHRKAGLYKYCLHTDSFSSTQNQNQMLADRLYIGCSSAKKKAQNKQNQENKEQNLCNTSRTGCNTTEAENGCDNGNN